MHPIFLPFELSVSAFYHHQNMRMRRQFISRILLCSSIILLLASCQKDLATKEKLKLGSSNEVSKAKSSTKFNTFYGHQVQLGDGKVRTFVTISHAGVPVEIGIVMTEDALQGLGDETIQLSFPFHKKAGEVTPFDHVLLDWNPHGHEPFFYESPHFDFHFYMTSEAERLAISATSPLMEQLPPIAYWPQGYVPTAGGVPQMGKHWINPLSPEISGGQPFTHTFIYGSYGGAFNFVEPMITRAFLLSGETVSMPYGQPVQFMIEDTYHPTKYNIYKKEGFYYITLTEFVFRT